MARNKWLKFDTETWLSDPKLRQVSLSVKGLWIDIICYCHINERYGYLQQDDRPMTQSELLSVLGRPRKGLQALNELTLRGILRIDHDGYMYCNKLLKDKELEERQKTFGKKGGNPTLKGTLNPTLNPTLKPDKETEEDKDKEKEKRNINISPKEKKSTHKKFESPSLQEVREHFFTKNYKASPDAFWEHFENRDWKFKDGKKMKSWVLASSTWERNHEKFDNSTQNNFKSKETTTQRLDREIDNAFREL